MCSLPEIRGGAARYQKRNAPNAVQLMGAANLAYGG